MGTVIVLWHSLNMVPWFGLQCVIVVFPDHTRLLFESFSRDAMEVSKMLLGASFDNVKADNNKLISLYQSLI